MVKGNPEEEVNVVRSIEWQGWRDKAIVSLILAFGIIFTDFLFGYSYTQIIANLGSFFYELIRKFGALFFTNFLILTCLTEISKRNGKEKKVIGEDEND